MKQLDPSQTEQVAGAALLKRPPFTTLALGEEGGGGTPVATTSALGSF